MMSVEFCISLLLPCDLLQFFIQSETDALCTHGQSRMTSQLFIMCVLMHNTGIGIT